MVCLQGENALFLPASSLSLADRFLPWISSLRNPWVGSPFGGPSPELRALAEDNRQIVHLLRRAVMTTRGDPAQLARLRAIIHQTRDALQAFLDEPQQPKGQGPVTDGEKHSVKGTDTVTTTLERLLPVNVENRWAKI